MSLLITSDIHINDKPLDAHRWELFPWLREQARQHGVKDIVINGDLTDNKDRHSSWLVNKFMEEIDKLSTYARVLINKGNHDYIDENQPFFNFLNKVHGVKFFRDIGEVTILDGKTALFLPSTRTPEEDWKEINFAHYDYIFCHQTFEGTVTSTGFPLSGIDPKIFGKTTAKIYSGDIHSKGTVGCVEYVGSPYRTNFGDAYNPRVLLVADDGKPQDLVFPCPLKQLVTIRDVKDLNQYGHVKRGDLVKTRVRLRRSEYGNWRELRDDILGDLEDRGWVNCGIELAELVVRKQLSGTIDSTYRSPAQRVQDYADQHQLEPELTKIGLSILESAQI